MPWTWSYILNENLTLYDLPKVGINDDNNIMLGLTVLAASAALRSSWLKLVFRAALLGFERWSRHGNDFYQLFHQSYRILKHLPDTKNLFLAGFKFLRKTLRSKLYYDQSFLQLPPTSMICRAFHVPSLWHIFLHNFTLFIFCPS